MVGLKSFFLYFFFVISCFLALQVGSFLLSTMAREGEAGELVVSCSHYH